MSAVEVDTGRPRPLSGGLWTLFSWLRRDEHSSSDSLSSVGSDRTAASFAFLPGLFAPAPRNPLVIPPPGPPTDSYKKRVRDRNVRRQHDRDITLLRKYGLHGFDAFSLPNARRISASERSERDRRATSELFQRRAHVPGKRRAPLPPPTPSTFTRRRGRKRPAPQPPLPIPTIPETLEDKGDTRLNNSATLPMNSHSKPNIDHSLKHNEVTMGCKPEKYSKKESITKEVKPRQEKSFLKQIFDNRKRNSAIETSTVKLLPSISELDKQAHEIIEKYKLKELDNNVPQAAKASHDSPGSSRQVEAWICTRCLRKYNATVITCLYCLPLENALLNNSSKNSRVSNNSTQTNANQKNDLEDKEKLKEILKEMKDSLRKTPMAGPSQLNNIDNKTEPKVVDAATLKISSLINTNVKNNQNGEALSPKPKVNLDDKMKKSDNAKEKSLATIQNVLVTQPTVLTHTKDNIVIVDQKITNVLVTQPTVLTHTKDNIVIVDQEITNLTNVKKEADKPKRHVTKTEMASKLLNAEKPCLTVSSNTKSNIIIPLKVSSLLNPIYVPKSSNGAVTEATNLKTETNNSQKHEAKFTISTETKKDSVIPFTSQISPLPPTDKSPIKKDNERVQTSSPNNNVIVKKIVQAPANTHNSVLPTTSQGTSTEASIVEKLDHHSRRRNLINQLEKSIAKGDENAAADAAVKLAQLRLSCSVLSFSSQIVAGTSSGLTEPPDNTPNKVTTKPANKENKQNLEPSQNTIKTSNENTTLVTPDKNVARESNKANVVEKRENVSQTNAQLVTQAVKPKLALNENPNQKKADPVQKLVATPPTICKDANVKKESNDVVPVLVWVEDKEATRGPVQIHIKRNARMVDLRRQAEKSLGLAVRMQRWIIGRALCVDDNTPLVTLAGPELTAPFYLCLVEAETKEPAVTATNKDARNVYNELVKLEQQSIVLNAELFECGVCMEECTPGKGVVLRECVHSFCKECLSEVVRHSEEPIVSCPATGCRGVLQEREIKGLVSLEDYEKWLARGLAMAESGTRNAFHCRTRDCTGWALCDPGVRRFPCPVCKSTNCVPCQAIHEGETCEQHRIKLQAAAATTEASNEADEGTRALLDSLIARGEALECPECSAIITKKWGCDWIKCSACKTEICWVTRGRRWGPAGRGDTSAGCRCGVDGKKCHPSCGYCH